MATTSTVFKKGEIRPGQGKRGPNKSTLLAKEAIARFADDNADRMQQWLDDVASDPKHGPKVAFDMLMGVMEYHLPKLARTEISGKDGGPVVVALTPLDERL